MSSERYTRATAPADRLQPDTWAMPAIDHLNARETRIFTALKEAICRYVDGKVMCTFLSERGLHREQLMRGFNRCLAPGSNGKQLGWVGLLPRTEVRPRRRRSPLQGTPGSKGGFSGALQQYFGKHPDVREALAAYIDVSATRRRGGEAGVRQKSVHVEFLRLCEVLDPEKVGWPFTAIRRGAGAIRHFVLEYLVRAYDRIVATQYGKKAATKAKAGTGYDSRLVSCMPFDIVELDEHVAGFIGTVRVWTEDGYRYLDAGRVTLLLLAERHYGWVLGFKVIFREAANADDAMDVLHAATIGEPGYAHQREGEATYAPLPRLNPDLGWCAFNAILLDNALMHLADELVTRTQELCGCAVNFGPVATPARRQLVERIFETLERAGFKRLQSTTGSGPHDPRRQDPESSARKCMLDATEIIDLVGLFIQKYNANIGKHNMGASPLQRMTAVVGGEEQGRYLFPLLPPLAPGKADLSKSVFRVRVKGNPHTGRRPYFTFLEADHTSPEIARDWELVGKELTLHAARKDLSEIPAFREGVPVGLCQPSGRWRHLKHDISLRRAINKLTRAGYLDNDLDGEPVSALEQKLGAEHTSARKPSPLAKSARRHYAEHAARQGMKSSDQASCPPTDHAEQLVEEMLGRLGEPTGYEVWDDIGALNGD